MKLTLLYEDMHDDYMDVYGPPLTGDLEADWRSEELDALDDEIDPNTEEMVKQAFMDTPMPPEEELINMTFDDPEPTLNRQADIRKKWYEGGYAQT